MINNGIKGVIAQLVEHFNGIEGVCGSIPHSSIKENGKFQLC